MLKLNNKGYSNLVPMVLAVVIVFALLFIGAYINGTIHSELDDNLELESSARGTMNNTSENWDSSLDIFQVVIIITVLAMAIGAIFLFTRFR